MRNIDFVKLELKNEINKKISDILTIKNRFFIRRNFKKSLLIFSILIPIFYQKQLFSEVKTNISNLGKNTIKWNKLSIEKKK